jgi:hypothetical protein
VPVPVPLVAEPVPPVPVPEDDEVPVPVPDDDVDDDVLGVALEVAPGVVDDAAEDWLELPFCTDGSDALTGATRSGVVLGTTSWTSLLPPQAVSPPVRQMAQTRAVTGRRTRALLSPTRRRSAPCAGRTWGSR